MTDLATEARAFRAWADRYPVDRRYGEWECDYDAWPQLHDATFAFLAASPLPTWTEAETNDVLYVIARDNEIQWVAREISRLHPDILVPLAAASIRTGDPDARWQLAVELGNQQRTDDAESLLLRLAADPDEYVRRHALQALAQIGSDSVEALALAAWNRPDQDQQWTRMMVLHCLALIDSTHLPRLLTAADLDGRQWLVRQADRIRRGELT